MSQGSFEVAVLSKTGGRARNEDACGYWAAEYSEFACYVLADGAGGHGGGDMASKIAVQTVLETFARQPDASSASVLHLLSRANEVVIERQGHERQFADMRSTLVLLEVDSRRMHAYWGHVGDSRLYCFMQGRFQMRTRDHSLVQDMVDAGLAQPGVVPSASERSVLTGSLGAEESFIPSTTREAFDIRDGSAFLMCSDGLWSALPDSSIESALQRSTSPHAWLSDLEDSLKPTLRPGSDNYSAIALWYRLNDDRTRLLPRAQADAPTR